MKIEELDAMQALMDAFAVHYSLPLAVRPAPGTELEIFDRDGFGLCYFSGMESDEHVADFMVAACNALPAAIQALRAVPSWPAELTDDLAFILGRPNFWCGPLAHIFQAAGYKINRKAEDEQAFVLHWLVGLLFKHGAAWREVAQQELEALAPSQEKGAQGV